MQIEKMVILDQHHWEEKIKTLKALKEWINDQRSFRIRSFPCVLIKAEYFGDFDSDEVEFLIVELSDFCL